MKQIKYLEGNRIYLRRVENEDIDHYLAAVSNPTIRKLTGTTDFLTRQTFENVFNKWSTDDSRMDLMICLQENDQVIGDLAILDIEHQGRKGSFRIAITDEEYTSKGYGTEALRLIIEYMFNTLNLRRISINVYAYNQRAIATYEKLGFKMEGTLREDLYFDGKYYDNYLMGLMKNEYVK
ncbi:GNAT family protein [Bacillus sp. FJAT-49736]|uniref:GNAT family N-acetyltransferase n=1 Tax=Bacillus sp. FJAT-49736 TaxID=2833582 RepID=UPI001BC9D018|nr:GNAT family protein [Bacillus sp. FJAT-49736]MBS4172171.1 GNAT family N-acetyltransferase [Bacillus sp. FJAT-49736]